MDAYLEAAIASANNTTQASISKGQLLTQARIDLIDREADLTIRKLESEVRMVIAALEARVRVAQMSDTIKIQLAEMLMQLFQNLSTMAQQRASVATELRREYQVNRLKMYMWRIELAETLMNAAVVPLGVPMAPPRPSEFETRVTAGLQTFVNVAGALAGKAPPVATLIAALVAGTATALLPRNI